MRVSRLKMMIGAPLLVLSLLFGAHALQVDGTEGPASEGPADTATVAVGGILWDPTDVRVNDPANQFPGRQKSLYETSVAIDPTDPQNVLAFAIDLSTQNTERGSYSTNRGYRSTDGGTTWTDQGPLPFRDGDAYWSSGDPVVLFTPEGTAYVSSLARAPDGSEGGIYVHRSDDGGATWDLPVLAVRQESDPSSDRCEGTDKEWLSHDPVTGTLYLAYSLFEYRCSSYVPGGDPTGVTDLLRFEGMSVRLTKSMDGGVTWSEPDVIQKGYRLGAMPRTGPDGTLYMTFYGNTLASTTGCPALLGIVGTAVFREPGLFDAIYVGVSHDGGENWAFHEESKCTHDFAETTKPGRFVGGNFLPSLTVDQSTGAAHLVYPFFVAAENRYTTMHISSTDHGASWSAPRDLTPGTEDARMPTVYADDGTVRVAYLISRDGDDSGDAAYIESADGGATWSEPVLLTSERWQLADDPDLGDYFGMDITGGRIVVAWTDARNGSTTEIWARSGSVA